MRISLGAQSMSEDLQRISWSAVADSGSRISAEPAAGTLTVRSEAKSQESVELHVPVGMPAGVYAVKFALRTDHGTSLPDVVTEIEVP